MNLKLMQDELAIVNSSDAFWQALDSNFSQASCVHDHGQGDEHFHMAGNFLIAQEKIREAIETVFGESFDSANHEHRDHLITLAAIQKAQDQLSGGPGFVSQYQRHVDKSHLKEGDREKANEAVKALFGYSKNHYWIHRADLY